MLKVFAVIGAVLVLGITVVLILAAMKPDQFQVQRSAAIKAPPEKIFPLINDFKAWTAWSPYETKDPDMKRTFRPATSGKGATYAWDGDGNVGAGNMLITDAPAPSKVALDLNMTKPMTAHNKVEFTLVPAGDTHDGHLGDARRHAVLRQGHPRVFQHGQNGRRRFRGGPRQAQGRRRKVDRELAGGLPADDIVPHR